MLLVGQGRCAPPVAALAGASEADGEPVTNPCPVLGHMDPGAQEEALQALTQCPRQVAPMWAMAAAEMQHHTAGVPGVPAASGSRSGECVVVQAKLV